MFDLQRGRGCAFVRRMGRPITGQVPRQALLPNQSPATISPFLELLDGIRPSLDRRLREIFVSEIAAARRRGRNVVPIVEAVRDLTLRGGKRLRAGLVVIGYRAVQPRASLAPAIEAAAALEILQSYLLIHDDWMDQDSSRRGGPAAHVHLARALNSVHLGAASAILAGDYGNALAYRVLAGTRIAHDRLVAMLQDFAAMQIDVVSGQQLDIVADTSNVETVYALKTSSYSVRGPLRMGALLGGAKAAVLECLDPIAMPLGIAFQHRDDLLGTFGSPELTGKPIGSDIRQGKQTLLAALAKRRLRGVAKTTFAAAFRNPKASEKRVLASMEVLRDSGIARAVEERIETLTLEAYQALNEASLPARTKKLLDSAIRTLVHRQY